MANFGDNLRNWIDAEWKSEDEKSMKIFEKEWEKATKKLVESTPEGQIRFALINRWKIIRRIRRKLMFKKSTFFIENVLTKKSHNKPFFATYPSNLDFRNFEEPSISYTLNEKETVLFYANNIEGYSNVGPDLIEFWFKTQVLPSFEKRIKGLKSDYDVTKQYTIHYYYNIIKEVLEHFGITLTENEYKEIFTNLCDKNGVKLSEFYFRYDNLKDFDYFTISL